MNWISIGSGNGLSPIRHQAISWTNAHLLSIAPLETNFIQILFKIQKLFIQGNPFENVICEMATILSRGGSVKHDFTQEFTSPTHLLSANAQEPVSFVASVAPSHHLKPVLSSHQQLPYHWRYWSLSPWQLSSSPSRIRQWIDFWSQCKCIWFKDVAWFVVQSWIHVYPTFAITALFLRSWPHLIIKTVFPRYRDSHVKDKTVVRPSYL